MAPVVSAAEALLAVATNFAEVVEQLEFAFEESGDHQLAVTTGSTGKLYAQITKGAPFDVFLAADQQRPGMLVASGLAVADSLRSYALGRLALWSAEPERIQGDSASLLKKDFRRFAMANPKLAPYGVAALETLHALGVYEGIKDRIVMGESVGQVRAMIATGNAELGFVALSYVVSPRNGDHGSYWIVPESLHTAIRQDVVLLKRALGNAAAQAFLEFLASGKGQAIIAQYGYGFE